VFIDEKEIVLTVKEFDLLRLLAQNPSRVFTKEELFAHVWQQIDHEDLHTVTVHVKSLREKLGDPVKNSLFIQTVWGKGYRLDRKSTRLNSSHVSISYAVFCLKKKKN